MKELNGYREKAKKEIIMTMPYLKKMALLLSVFGFLVLSFHYSATGSVVKIQNENEILSKTYSLQVPFIENTDWIHDKGVKYYAKTFAGTAFVMQDGKIVYSFPQSEKEMEQGGLTLKETFVGASISHINGEDKAIAKINYFKGKESSQWRRNIPTYNCVSFGEIYKGIELSLKAYGNNVEKLFQVKPFGDSKNINVKIEGAKSLIVNDNGQLEINTGIGAVKFTEPVAYQEENGERTYVEVAYAVKDNEYGFTVGDYDRTKELFIDPLLASTYLGGSGDDYCIEIAVDHLGNVIVAGVTTSIDFPEAFSEKIFGVRSNKDIFIAKMNPSCSELVYFTLIGGSQDEHDVNDDMELYRFGMTIDGSGNIYVTSNTGSPDFPITEGALYPSFNGGGEYDDSANDAFIVKLSSTGDELLYSTFLGGSYNDHAGGIALDTNGNIYIVGDTSSPDFPIKGGVSNQSYNGQTYHGQGDIFIVKINSLGSDLIYSTYLDGSGWDESTNIAVDPNGNACILGGGDSIDYPTTTGAIDPNYNGGEYDIYVTKLNSGGTDFIYSTYLGGKGEDWAEGLAVDSSGNVYVTGQPDGESTDFPVTPGALDTTYGGNDAFIAKINSEGTELLYSTFLGSNNTGILDIKVDVEGNAFVTGGTEDPNFPTTPDASDLSFNGGIDIIISIINPTGTGLIYSSFLGGSSFDAGVGLTSDFLGNIYLTGVTNSVNFPTQMPIQSSNNGGSFDAFVLKLSYTSPSVLVSPQNYAFEDIYVNDTQMQTFSVINTGSADLVVGDFNITGTDASEFTIQSNTCLDQLIYLEESCIIEVAFLPLSQGAKSAELSISSNDQEMEQLIISLTATVLGGLADSAWPCRGHDSRHTGQSPYLGTQTNTLKWRYQIGDWIESSPAIGVDDTIYIGTADGYIYALNPNALDSEDRVRWRYATGAYVASSPAIGADGTVYVGSYNGKIYALNPNADDPNDRVKWSFQTEDDVYSSPAIGEDGTIYIGSEEGRVYALNPDPNTNERLIWSYPTFSGEVYSSPAIGSDGTVYVATTGGMVYALYNTPNPDSRIKWSYHIEGAFYSSPAIGEDGTIYIGSSNNNFYALDPNGTLKWSCRLGDDVDSSPAIGADGTIYVGCDDGKIYALYPEIQENYYFYTNAQDNYDLYTNNQDNYDFSTMDARYALNLDAQDFRIKWSYQTGDKVWSSPAIGSDGTVYIGSGDGNVYALDPNGSLKWSYQTEGWVGSSPAIGSEGTIYIGSGDGKIYAFGSSNIDISTEDKIVSSENTHLRDNGNSDSSGIGCFLTVINKFD